MPHANYCDLFTYRDEYPNAPGFRARDTSYDAAEAIAPKANTLRASALLTILHSNGGLTADEVAAQLNQSILAIRPRITELARLGAIKDSGLRRPNQSGRNAIVWKV
jgi:hypothetical protein